MDISLRSSGAVTVLDLTGRLVVSADEREIAPLRNAICAVIRAGHLDIVVNLSGLTYIDARGLGELAMAMKTVDLAGGHLTLAAASPRVARILAVTRLDRTFEWCDKDVEERPQVREPECCDAVPGTN
jgi:anti-sigma B factor antagonist